MNEIANQINTIISNTHHLKDHIYEILLLANLLDYETNYYAWQVKGENFYKVEFLHKKLIYLIFIENDSSIFDFWIYISSSKINTLKLSNIKKLQLIKEAL